MGEIGTMTLEERHAQVEGYLGKTVTIEIDRPIGTVHHKGEKTLVYPINYGYIPEVFGGDGKEIGAKINIPNHYDMFESNSENPHLFADEISGGLILEFNKIYHWNTDGIVC